MLKISYKIKGLSLNELWFSQKIPYSTWSLFSLYCYRDTRIDTNVFGLKKEIKYTLINDLTIEKDKLFLAFKSNVRNEIRKCDKIENFRYEGSASSKELFLNFYADFAKAKNLTALQIRSIEKYQNNIFYVSAYLEDALTNMQVYVVDEQSKIVRLLHSISTLHNEDDKHKRAQIGWINRYLHWKMMLRFKALGFRVFDWGGHTNDSNSALAGIDKFKESFGGEKIKLYNYYTLPYFAMKSIQEKLL